MSELTREEVEAWRGITDGFMDPAAKVEFNKLVDLALKSIDQQRGWMKIEDAPKDGTIIIVKGGIAHWYNDDWYTLTAERYPGRRIEWNVHHFQPLPKPPEQHSEGG